MQDTTVPIKRRSFAQGLIAGAISGLVGSELLKDSRGINDAIVVLRQVVIELEKQRFASKNDVEKCFEMISVMEREI